ncbi:hypothetical protein N0B44_15480 [Roseibacterium beibuensis]|uniref:Uncharacterized protein n=1 Tax=[Roseibacterium] beibuensis TaxID=1193142 RepID=A0ABP9LCF3_9RHOB|nr:hypothetical protein [Roseibacterium beibuensis]MCS6624320.1 hypothetical protein [Roseibacterium beibuensis]
MVRALFLSFTLSATAAKADPAAIIDVMAERGETGWRFAVTLRHGDTGWDDYADGWRIETLSGEVLGTRELLHPHVEEQPFTRSLSGVAIPAEVTEVMIRARTTVEGWDRASFGPVLLD